MPAVLKTAVPKRYREFESHRFRHFTKETNMVERYLFLDDERMPGDVTWCELPSAKYEVVRNYDEFVRHVLTFGVPKFVAFDHDLADFHYEAAMKDAQQNSKMKLLFEIADEIVDVDYGYEKTGYDCAKWLVDFCEERNAKFPDFVVHSMNPVGGLRIKQYVENAKKHLNI